MRDAVWALARAAAITAAEWRRRHADGAFDGMDDEDDDESEPRDEGRDAEDDDAGTANDAEAPDDAAGVVAGPALPGRSQAHDACASSLRVSREARARRGGRSLCPSTLCAAGSLATRFRWGLGVERVSGARRASTCTAVG